MQKISDERDPRRPLSNVRAIAKIRELATSARVCFFGTQAGRTLAVRPMAVQDVDAQGNVWFLSGRSSAKNRQIARHPRVQLLFANVGDSEYLNLHGVASISADRDVVKEHWTPLAKTWFHHGVHDPEATAIKVRIDSGYYWDTRRGKTVSLLHMAVGALTGRTFDDSLEGAVRPQAHPRTKPGKKRSPASARPARKSVRTGRGKKRQAAPRKPSAE
jgi:general stress protein 26